MAISRSAFLVCFTVLSVFSSTLASPTSAAGDGTSIPTPLLGQAGQQIAAVFGIEGGGSSINDGSSSRKLLDAQGADAVCTCGSRTHRGATWCWCSCGRKLQDYRGAASGTETDMIQETVTDDISGLAGHARGLATADAVNAADGATATNGCECRGERRTYSYSGAGCNCWVNCG